MRILRVGTDDAENLACVSKSKNQYAAQNMTNNLFTDVPTNLPEELLTTLLEAANVRIERIVSQGHVSPEGFWYDQDEHEWVIVLKGAATLRFEESTLEMKPGDSVNIPAHRRASCRMDNA
jgi:cupin 2 domain-containing protein